MAIVNGNYGHQVIFVDDNNQCGDPIIGNGPLVGPDFIEFQGVSATYSHTVTFSSNNPNCSVSPSSHTVSTIVNATDTSFFASNPITVNIVSSFNDAPVLGNISNQTMNEDRNIKSNNENSEIPSIIEDDEIPF